MRENTTRVVVILGLLMLVPMGCDDDSNDSETMDEESDAQESDGANGSGDRSDTDTEQPEGQDSDRLVDTEGFEALPCGEIWGDPNIDYDYEGSYAKGPWGFKTSLCWEMTSESQGTFFWGGAGDILPDFCLPDHEGNEVCMHDFYKGEHDLLILDFSAGWCPVCHASARQAVKWQNSLREAGWNPVIVHIISNNYDYANQGPPTIEDAQKWKSQYPKAEYVLYDENLKWVDAAVLDIWMEGRRDPTVVGFPFYYYVHTSNMRVWDTWAGFPDGLLSQFKPWFDQEVHVLDFIANQPFAIGN